MSDRLNESGDAVVVLITFTRPRNLAGFRHRLGLTYPVLADEHRDVYRAYGLGRGSWWRVWGLRTMRTYFRLVRAGRRVRRPTEDTLQLGGDFIVGRDGRIRYVYRSAGPDDRPAIGDLLGAVRAAG